MEFFNFLVFLLCCAFSFLLLSGGGDDVRRGTTTSGGLDQLGEPVEDDWTVHLNSNG